MTSITRTNVTDLLKSYKEALQYWKTSLNSSESITEIKSAQVSDPLAELTKLCKLIKAHTTKVGIIFKPDVSKTETKTSYETLQKLSESTVLLVSVIAQLKPSELSEIFHGEILAGVNDILSSAEDLIKELLVLEDQEQQGTNEDGRLVSVGKVWSSCDSLDRVLSDGKLGVLNKKFKQSIELIEDGVEDFAEWAEDPEEQGFGFSDSEEEEGEEEEEEDDNNSIDEATKEQVTKISKIWIERFKLVKLLYTSVSKSLPSVTKGETIDFIYHTQKKIANLIDELVVDLMSNCKVTKKTEQIGASITKQCEELLKVVKEVNKSSESKVKWCDSWENKFTSI